MDERTNEKLEMHSVNYQAYADVELNVSLENILRAGFEPSKIETGKMLKNDTSPAYSKHKLTGFAPFFRCNLGMNEYASGKNFINEGKRRTRVCELDNSNGNCNYNTEKEGDIERHLITIHSEKFSVFDWKCSHCPVSKAKRYDCAKHMNVCASIYDWIKGSNSAIVSDVFRKNVKKWTDPKMHCLRT